MKTSRIKTKVPKVATCKYKLVNIGEVFEHSGLAYIKTNDGCIGLSSGGYSNIGADINVNMLEAELLLKFREVE